MKLTAQQANKETAIAIERKWEEFVSSVDSAIQHAVLNGDYICYIWAPNGEFTKRIISLLEENEYRVEYINGIRPMRDDLAVDAQRLAISWK